MTAVVMVTGVSGWIPMIGVMVILGLGVLIPHLGAYKAAKETAKRVIAAALVAGLTATVGGVSLRAYDDFVISCDDRCAAIECWWHCLTNLMGGQGK